MVAMAMFVIPKIPLKQYYFEVTFLMFPVVGSIKGETYIQGQLTIAGSGVRLPSFLSRYPLY